MTPSVYSVHPTPVGDALIVMSDEGLVALQLIDGAPGDRLAELSVALGAVPDRDATAIGPVAAELDEYFAGRRRAFDVAIDWRLTRGFVREALQVVCRIPYGETASYGEVALGAGHPNAHRAVGSACARTPISLIVPVHRVVRSDGTIGEYGGHPGVKRYLLDLEAAAGE
ncbi:methylated-DNA--[protein]-cysteine S-methyltransferase [Microbacterium sp. zg.Y625]|uniref:methylated-DNA--[protein]-cysteine S-methyltransferase n=1 Tax=Microbacterium jiangjiandongii TaxID=3049071 RepID=UPI00214B33BD|nr:MULTISPECIES: methylated-DNA--[protein]-cysteine S-methyltransferase [unclassified Microbacterium]MCR2791643.1 methylated-DNA--[protein]-cysteine S-methyltransferase [Microbacterium sp. zg.Y625]WIM24464.1 methylated-DNA--[protein]-cysteine S-methyltransferase [Microbacterium sp. zg-Y625]